MKTRGRRHSPGEKHLLAQVADVFTKKKQELGAKRAANQLSISLASFYNYAAGTDLPRMEVLRDAKERWGIKWDLIDPSAILRTRKVRSSEQYLLSFLDVLREEDVEVVEVEPVGKSALRIMLNIRFPA